MGLPLAFWIGCEVFHRVTSNPEPATTYREYRATLPTPQWVRQVETNGQTCYLAAGPTRAPLAFPSGPPVYVFDVSGALVDWSLDEGEDVKFQGTWSKLPGSRITVEELDRVLGQGNELLQEPQHGPISDEPK
ncbi:MAG: hypothetical protein H7A46_05615 [Verrucomicrobiales bacterium]|nr:hypothetical protein [Verrucomicrobiales bacterium]